MRKSRISLAFAAIFALGLTACGDPNDQRGDPTDPTQQAPVAERESRQQANDSKRDGRQSADRRDDERTAGRVGEDRADDDVRNREARQTDARTEGNINDTLARDGYDPATNANTQPVPASQDFHRPDLLARNFDELGDLEDEENVRARQQAREELLADIERSVGNREADDVNQCAFVPLGHKPCGGPERYMVYSERDMSDGDIESFEAKIARYNQLDAFIKTAENRVSTCDITPRPEIGLEGGRCVARDSRFNQPRDIE